MAQKIQMRRDSVENWLDVNPILARGEWGIAFDGTSTDVIAIKIGDGESDWESLQSLLPINSSDTVVGYIAESRLDDETGFNAYDGEGVQSVVLWADLSGVTVFVRNSGRVCTADGAGSYTTVDAPPGFYATEDGVVALMPEVGTPSILSPTGGAGLVADAINDGTTTVAPSQNAVFDGLALKQPLDADLTAIAALAPSDDALIQRKAGAWTSRTPAQVKADMSIGVGDVSGFDEQVRDVVGTALVAGSNVTITVNDGSDTITIASTGGGGGSSEPFLIDGEPLDSESGFWGPLFDLWGVSVTTGTWDNPEFPDGNSISLATPSVEQQTLGYTAKWKLNLSPLNRGQGLKGLHFSGAGVEGGVCAWLVTDASDVAVAGGEWNQGRKVDPGSGFGYPGKAVVAVGGDGSLTDMYFDNVIYPEEGELFYLQLAMSHLQSPYEGVMSVDLIVTPIWEDANESYTPGQPSTWEDLDGDVPETKKEALDTLIGLIAGVVGDLPDVPSAAPILSNGVQPTDGVVYDLLTGSGLTPTALPSFTEGVDWTADGHITISTLDAVHTGLAYIFEWEIERPPDHEAWLGFDIKGAVTSSVGEGIGATLTLTSSDSAPYELADGFTWMSGEKEDFGASFGQPGKAIMSVSGDGPLGDLVMDKAFHSDTSGAYKLTMILGPGGAYEGIMGVDITITPIEQDANESYNPAEASQWEDLTGDAPDSKTEALDMLVGEIGLIKHDIEDLIGAPQRVDVTESIVGRTTKKVFIDASASDPDPFIVYLPKLEDITDGHEIEFFRVDDTANVLQITPDGTTDDRFSLNDIATIPFVQVTPMVGRVRLVADTINGWWWPEASYDPTD